MKLGVLVNDVRGIGPKQTTLRLIDVAMRMGHEVLVSGVDDLTLDTAGALRLGVRALGPRDVTDSDDALVGRIASATPRQVASEALDGMLIRTRSEERV